jgi:putative ABC transport system permease protein
VTITTNHLDDPLKRNQTVEPVYGVSPGLRDAARARVDGRWLDRWEQETGAKVVVLGRAVARKLEISRPGRLVYLDGVPFWVAGILLSSEAAPQLTAGIVVSDRVSLAFGEPSDESYMLLRTAPGAAQVIARQAPIQVLPEGPEDLAASAPPDPRTLRNEVESDTARTVISMALVSVLIGAISIANSALTGIYQRTHEIGLRRALGATPRHVLAQTLIETTVLGLVAGLAGSLIGIMATLAVALNAGWTPVIDPWVPLAAPLLGALVGAVAGVYPALRAARIEPSTALRSQ